MPKKQEGMLLSNIPSCFLGMIILLKIKIRLGENEGEGVTIAIHLFFLKTLQESSFTRYC